MYQEIITQQSLNYYTKTLTTDKVSDFLYGVRKMSLQDSPWHPDAPKTITMLPSEEVKEFQKKIVSRYVKQVKRGWVKRFFKAFQSVSADVVSDQEFIRIYTQSVFAKSLSHKLTQEDRINFHLSDPDLSSYYKIDYSFYGKAQTIEGVYTASSKTLLKKEKNGSFRLLCIYMNDLRFRPEDGDAWELAKYFVLAAGGFYANMAEHPMVHFPMDAVNAMTKTIFPTSHPVFKLIYPHTYLQLPLNYGVLNIPRSVLHNNPAEIYTPFHYADKQTALESIARTYQGSFETVGYQYPMEAEEEHTDYHRFINAYRKVIMRFVARVLQDVPKYDPYVSEWASILSDAVHGFPNAEEIWQEDNLVRAVAAYICNCAIVHSLDHHTYAKESITKVPLRLSVPSPQSKDIELDRSKLISKDDHFRHEMFHSMYASDHVVRHLLDVDYQFSHKRHRQYAQQFFDELHEAEQALDVEKFIPLKQFACSIQY